ncbi:MAG: FHA domain-containing protein [Coriobacteriales bacterium]|jgi:pSer/pThr/pTyr-binding forkhead associated (FHA) protein|nr:FHA domain-containing protein [Coriobacteriales bacterium]
MDEARICPVCGTEAAADVHECERCGFNLVGLTEEMASPGPAGSGVIDDKRCGKAHLTLTKGPLKGEVFYLESFPVTIGRDPNCDIFLNNMTVSRTHAIIERLGDKVVVRDNNSLNGTWVDGRIVEEAELLDDALLQVGTFSMRFSCI